MGRKKSIATQLSGKSLAQARQHLRDIEKQMIDGAYREVGQLILDVFNDDPELAVFEKNSQLQKSLVELQQVAGKKSRKSQLKPAQSESSTVAQQTYESVAEPSQIVKTRPGYEPGRFVADVPDGDL